MKKGIILIATGFLIGWILSMWSNHPGHYQVVDIINPKHQIHQTYLLNTHTGGIQQLVYGLTDNLYWSPAEAKNEKEYNQRYIK